MLWVENWRWPLDSSVIISGDELSLLFNADKLLDFLTENILLSDNSTLKMVNKLASGYDGMMLGVLSWKK